LAILKDELVDEYQKAESDWQKKIDADLLKWATAAGLRRRFAAGG